jgi:hypothetical protein
MITAKLIDFVSIMALIWFAIYTVASIILVFDRINNKKIEICPIKLMVFVASIAWLFVFKF